MKQYESERVRGIPPSGIRKMFDRVRELERQGQRIISFQIGEPDFDTPVHIKTEARTALEDGFVHYTPNAGIPELRTAISEKLRTDNGIEADPDGEIIVTVGANEAVTLAVLATINPGDEVLVPDPCWPNYWYVTRLAGGIPISVPLKEENGFQIMPEDVATRITPRTKMLMLNTPGNPTGAILSREITQGLADLAEHHDLLVLSDEIYEKIRFNGAEHTSIASLPGMRERTFTVNGFSKAYAMTGWRLGYVAGPRALVSAMLKIHQYTVTSSTSFAQKGAVAALRGPQAAAEGMVAEFDRRRRVVVEHLNQMPGVTLVEPQGAFYAFPNIRHLGMSDSALAEALLEQGHVGTIPGSVFGEGGKTHLRIAFSCSYPQVVEGMDKMTQIFKELYDNHTT